METIRISPKSVGVKHIKDNLYEWSGIECKRPTHIEFAPGMSIRVVCYRGIDTRGGDIDMHGVDLWLDHGWVRTRGGRINMYNSSLEMHSGDIWMDRDRLWRNGGDILMCFSEIKLYDGDIHMQGGNIDTVNGSLYMLGGGVFRKRYRRWRRH